MLAKIKPAINLTRLEPSDLQYLGKVRNTQVLKTQLGLPKRSMSASAIRIDTYHSQLLVIPN